MIVKTTSLQDTQRFAEELGKRLPGGSMLELRGDVGVGKTAFIKGLAWGMGVEDDVQSPSFTLSRVYEVHEGLQLHHYDFYRLHDPGVLSYELAESLADPQVVTVVEWADVVEGILPPQRYVLQLSYGEGETERTIVCQPGTKELEEAYAAWSEN